MYGSTEEEKPGSSGINNEIFPLVKTDGEATTINVDDESIKRFLGNPFNEDFSDETFWEKITKLYDDGKEMVWSSAMNKIRLDYIREHYKLEKKDPLVALFLEVYDEFAKHAGGNNPQSMSSFKQQFSEFVRILLQEDYDNAVDQKNRLYAWPMSITNQGKKTVLHLAAERDITEIAKMYVGLYPGHVYEPTSGKGLDRLPLEVALMKRYDDMASFLIKNMLHERVRDLFESNETFDARFQLADIINDPSMKRTVIGVLDCCINADWPYVPVKTGQRKEEAWSKIPEMPLRYHFHYRLLDGDQKSEPPTVNGIVNQEFNHRSKSCLQLLAESSHNQEAITHPVVRMLVNRKWDMFAGKKIRVHFVMYMAFLILMGLAFFIHPDATDRKKYSSDIDYFRGVCEVLTLFVALAYLLVEVDQMEKERLRYFKDVFNAFDLIGLITIFCVVPLRYTDQTRAEFSLMAVAFLFNCLRIFKYFPAFKQLGVYSKTFYHIILYDITKFSVLYAIVMVAFTGCVFLSMKASNIGDPKTPKLGFWEIFLKEARALTEGNAFEDDYSAYSTGMIIFIMLNMMAIIVILSNILIGQLSFRYESAMEQAEIQYSIDKAKFITRIENSRFSMFNSRIAHYVAGDYVGDDQLVSELLEDWEKLQTTKSEESKVAIRNMMEKILKTKEKED